MKSRETSDVWIVGLGIAASCAVAAALAWEHIGLFQSLVFILGLAGLVGLINIPVHWLPAVALVAFAVVPGQLVPTAYVGRAVTPGTIVLIIWVLKVFLTKRKLRIYNPFVLANIFALLIWSAATSYLSELSEVSFAWSVSMMVAVLLPVLLGSEREADLVARTWILLGAVLSVYTIIEAVLGRNIVFGYLADNDVQHWSVYRAYASFGHPLLAGTFFVATFGLALGMWLRGNRQKWLLSIAILSLIAVFATISRGAIVTAVVVVAAFAIIALLRRSTTVPRALSVVGIIVVSVFAAMNTPRLVERIFSVEGSRSNDARRSGFDVALVGADHFHWLGAGPAMSQRAVAQFNVTQVRIESAYLQLLLSVGLPGLAFFSVAMVGAGCIAVRDGRLGALGALLGVLVSIGFYNSIDARWGSHILIGLALFICLRCSTTRDGGEENGIRQGSSLLRREPSPSLDSGAVK